MNFQFRVSIPIVPSYKYLGCEIDEFLDLNLMLEKRVESGKAALNGLLHAEMLNPLLVRYMWVPLGS